MERLIKGYRSAKYRHIVPIGAMRFLDFARLQLATGERHSLSRGERECVLDVFSGTASIAFQDDTGRKLHFDNVGGRDDVFTSPPVMVYVPPKTTAEIVYKAGPLDIGIFSAPAQIAAEPALLAGAAVAARQVGKGNWMRTVYTALGENVPAERLLAGETLNPPGNWSSYPPHKHDKSDPPREAVLEEIYFFRVKPASGYGFIWTYTAPGDPDGFSNVFVVEDGDTVLLPKGYHPVVAAPGYELHYTWVLAGEERRYGAWADDPRHAWVKNQ
jgi:5-deoxy-glucuronate isomerase